MNGSRDILFTTKFDRGLDLKDGLCRSIILLKQPIPDFSSEKIKLIREQYDEIIFQTYLNDIIFREVKQNIGRVLRHKDDFADFLTPDLKLLQLVPHIWLGKINYI